MKKNKKLILAAGLLLLFAAIKLVALDWWLKQQPSVQTVSACDIREGCILPNGAKVVFEGLTDAKGSFDVRVSDAAASEVYVSFSMRDMDMGFNRYDLKQQGDVWLGSRIRLPVCVAGRHDYLADVHVGKQVYQIAFHAE